MTDISPENEAELPAASRHCVFHRYRSPIDFAENKTTKQKKGLSSKKSCSTHFDIWSKLSARKLQTKTNAIHLLKSFIPTSAKWMCPIAVAVTSRRPIKPHIQNAITVYCCFKGATTWTWTHPWPPCLQSHSSASCSEDHVGFLILWSRSVICNSFAAPWRCEERWTDVVILDV